MSHSHWNCTKPTGGSECLSGHLTDYCDDQVCGNSMCMSVGHCKCKCHTGKLCGTCGKELEAT